jgi:hypothetical protein
MTVPSTKNTKSNSDMLSKHFRWAAKSCKQVALLARLALHRIAARPPKKPGSLFGKAVALAVQRLWSAARLTLTGNQCSMLSARLMQLLHLKQRIHVHLLNDRALP